MSDHQEVVNFSLVVLLKPVAFDSVFKSKQGQGVIASLLELKEKGVQVTPLAFVVSIVSVCNVF